MQPVPPRIARLCWAAVFIITTGAGHCWSQEETGSPVVVSPVVEQQVRTGHRVIGTVTPVRKSLVGSAVDGRVLEYLIEAGDAVYAGQPLAQLRTGTLEIERAAAVAELAVRKAELALARIQAAAREHDIAEAKATARRAEVARENAQRKLARGQSLLERGAINRDEYDDLQEASLAAEQTMLAAESSLARIKAGPAQELIDQAVARVQLQQEQVRLIDDRLDKFRILAPFDGFVSVEHTQEGEWIQEGDPVAELVQLDKVDVVANVPSEFAVRLILGSSVRVEFPPLPEHFLTGMVTRIVPSADAGTRTYPVHIRVSNLIEDGRPLLLAGMLARVDLPTGTLDEARLVPKDALVLNRGERDVFVARPSTEGPQRHTVRKVPVTLGVTVDALVQVHGELQPGDLVVIRGNERLVEGEDVMIQQSDSEEQTYSGE